ncbi:MAG: hypothetical protein QOG87_4059 [Actinomycetota bacterium]|jgi:hypothetical protein
MLAILSIAPPAGAGSVGSVIEGATSGSLAIAVSERYFPAGSASGVVVTNPDRAGMAAIAAAFAGGAAGRVPLLFTGHGVSDAAVRAEIARATDGARPTVWLAGATLGGLEGYDVQKLGDSAGDVAGNVIATGPAAGTGNRVLVFDDDDWRAGAVAAGFGAAYGIPLLPADSIPSGLGVPKPVAIVVGSASVPADRFARVDRVEGADPTALSVAVATTLVAKEFPAGAPVTVPVPLQPVAADGFGADPGPALLAAVVAAALQADGARPPVLLVDARPTADLAGGCAAAPKDAAALCLMAKGDGATAVLALTAVGRSDGAPAGSRLPGTGGVGFPLVAVALVMGVLIVRRRVGLR